jgi:hypothetical protein
VGAESWRRPYWRFPRARKLECFIIERNANLLHVGILRQNPLIETFFKVLATQICSSGNIQYGRQPGFLEEPLKFLASTLTAFFA